MLRKNNRTYVKGGWNVICDRCGWKRKNTEVAKEWDNLIVCKDTCYEPRQPQDFVRAIPDMRPVPDARPDSDPQFITGPIVPGE